MEIELRVLKFIEDVALVEGGGESGPYCCSHGQAGFRQGAVSNPPLPKTIRAESRVRKPFEE